MDSCIVLSSATDIEEHAIRNQYQNDNVSIGKIFYSLLLISFQFRAMYLRKKQKTKKFIAISPPRDFTKIFVRPSVSKLKIE